MASKPSGRVRSDFSLRLALTRLERIDVSVKMIMGVYQSWLGEGGYSSWPDQHQVLSGPNALSAVGVSDADNPLTPIGLHRVHTAMVATSLRHGPLYLASHLQGRGIRRDE